MPGRLRNVQSSDVSCREAAVDFDGVNSLFYLLEKDSLQSNGDDLPHRLFATDWPLGRLEDFSK